MVSKDKAYIVANEQQEREVLDKLYIDGMTWCGGEEATQIIPSDCYFGTFPYVIYVGEWLSWNKLSTLEDEEIVFDGRKEERMSEKYVVSQEFMDELEDWKQSNFNDDFMFVNEDTIADFSDEIDSWWYQPSCDYERNNRLIAIIRWVNGEDVFEVEKPKKWVVRSKDHTEQGSYLYVMLDISHGIKKTINFWDKDVATRFDTKEEAESWANSHQEVVEAEV